MKQTDDHIRAQELFSAYIDNQTTADERNFVVRHLAVCDEDCRAQLAVMRAMIQATRTMPIIKAPRSFVLPKAMGRQPARSIFAWYPALRLATSLAVIAFVLVFAGDLFSQRSASFSANVPSAANAPQLSAAAQPTAAAALNAAPPAATAAAQASAPQSLAGVLPTATATVTSAAAAVPSARSADVLTPTDETITSTLMTTAEVALAQTPIVPPAAEIAPQVVTSAAPAANPAGAIEIVLAGLVIALGTATFIARRRTRSN